jgi:hypothetical protein
MFKLDDMMKIINVYSRMLVISKNKSKSSQAVVKFTKKPVKKPPVPILRPLPMPQTLAPPNVRVGVQSQLTENTFRQYLVGFVQITPRDLPATLGKRLRYAIDTMNAAGRVVSTQYRLGGIVKAVSGDNVTMFNPSAKKTWTLKITQPKNKRLRLYFNVPNNRNATINALLAKIQSGHIKFK